MATRTRRTQPELWESVKAEITASDKGGHAAQWSARKAQLAVQEYKRRGKTGERYLPREAREALTDEEYRRTTQKKRADLSKGRQFSRQPADVARKITAFRSKGRKR